MLIIVDFPPTSSSKTGMKALMRMIREALDCTTKLYIGTRRNITIDHISAHHKRLKQAISICAKVLASATGIMTSR